MSTYLALYRKYRPTNFSELVGQEAVATTLSRALTQGRLSHAYLFCGPRGTGKTSVARILAKSVNCEQGPTDKPCGLCGNCRDIGGGVHLDVIEIDAASNNGVDNIRDLQDRVALAPVAGRRKVYIIDEVHMLSQGAFNALLKTLEEPPAGVMFILATTDPHKVLPTIVSRCQRFDFGRIPLPRLVERLSHVASKEGIAGETAAWEAIARRANGGLRDALSLLDQLAAMAGGDALDAARVARGLGLLAGDQVVGLAQALVEGQVGEALTLAGGLLSAGHDHAVIVRELLVHFRHLMVLQMVPDDYETLEVPGAHLEVLRSQAAKLTSPEVSWVLETLAEADTLLRRSPQQTIWLELTLMRLSHRPEIPSLRALTERVEVLERRLGGPVEASGSAVPRSPLPASAPSVLKPVSTEILAPAANHVVNPVPSLPRSTPEPPPSGVSPTQGSGGESDQTLPPRPPLGVIQGGQAPTPPVSSPVSPPVRAKRGGPERALPPGVWERLHAYVRARSVPTAALLAQKAAIHAWESDGAVVLRMSRPFKEQFERQAAKKELLLRAIQEVFGSDAYLRIDVADGTPPRPSPVAFDAAARATPHFPEEDPPPPVEPVGPLHDEEVPPPVVTSPETRVAEGIPVDSSTYSSAGDDSGLRLVAEIFNGRVITPSDS